MNTRVESRGRNRIRGKKRIEIIQKFLEGEEDPKYEVVPTVTEGKYFVRPRKNESKSELKRHEMNEEEEEIERSKDHKLRRSEEPKEKLKPKQKQKLHSNETLYDQTISYQILEQLKLLGEEQKLKREKKEQKKLVKHQIRKQLKQQKRKQESSEEYESPEEEPVQIYRPLNARRKVNLNK